MNLLEQIHEVEKRLDKEKNTADGVPAPRALSPNPCRSFKMYRGIQEPRCGCEPCWKVYEDRRAERIALLTHRLETLRKQKDCNHQNHFKCPPINGTVLHKCFSCWWEWETKVKTPVH